jgi:hypothetical protein
MLMVVIAITLSVISREYMIIVEDVGFIASPAWKGRA